MMEHTGVEMLMAARLHLYDEWSVSTFLVASQWPPPAQPQGVHLTDELIILHGRYAAVLGAIEV
jgi:hypothetical protein